MIRLSAHAPRTRADVVRLACALLEPIEAHRSPGGARVVLGTRGARHSEDAQGLEGFARPLWALASLAAGGEVDPVVWSRVRDGLRSGTDPRHPEYWGEPGTRDQRLVEMAAIGFALALVPELSWEPLEPEARRLLSAWLVKIHQTAVRENNWLFLRVLVDTGLERVGAAHAPASREAAFRRIHNLYVGGGWYSDGEGLDAGRDHYTAWAFHALGLVYARLGQGPAEVSRELRARARLFAPRYAAWFDPTGRAVPYGRSQAYRFAQGAFWSALAFADEEALPWGVTKGLLLRHLRWWCTQPITLADGTLSAGYAYPEAPVAEGYVSAASPYWAMKAFLVLAVPESHPFWAAEERPLECPEVLTDDSARAVVSRARTHVVLLPGGRGGAGLRQGAAKYGKFAYSSAFGFSIPADSVGVEQMAPDGELVLSVDGRRYFGRERPSTVVVTDGVVRSEWAPLPSVQVTSWVVGCGASHLRLHHVRTGTALRSAEGGFAVPLNGEARVPMPEKGRALARGASGWSAVRDVALRTRLAESDEPASARPYAFRIGRVVCTEPNTNVMAPRTMLPLLVGEHPPGEHWLLGAFYGESLEHEGEAQERDTRERDTRERDVPGGDGLEGEEPPDWGQALVAVLQGGELQLRIGGAARNIPLMIPSGPAPEEPTP